MSETQQASMVEGEASEEATWARLKELAEHLVDLADEAQTIWICIPDTQSNREAALDVASLMRQAGCQLFDLAGAVERRSGDSRTHRSSQIGGE